MKINGKKVRDAREPLFFYVDIQDVKAASPKDPTGCAAVKAIERQCGCKQARVYRSSVLVEYPKEWIRYKTPADLHGEVMRFDRGGKFESRIFRLQTPNPSKKLGARKGKKPGTRVHKATRKSYRAVARVPARDVRQAAPRGRAVA